MHLCYTPADMLVNIIESVVVDAVVHTHIHTHTHTHTHTYTHYVYTDHTDHIYTLKWTSLEQQ